MRYRFHTRSGSCYVINTFTMRWFRNNPTDKRFILPFNGDLIDEPIVRIGKPCFMPVGPPMTTSIVERIELLDD